jgi:hypothetical protein
MLKKSRAWKLQLLLLRFTPLDAPSNAAVSTHSAEASGSSPHTHPLIAF